MNKQSIIGLVLIFAIFIGYLWWVAPSKEEIAAQRAHADSLYRAQMDSIAVADSLAAVQADLEKRAEEGDSAALAQLHVAPAQKRADMGVFNVNVGEEKHVVVKNDVMDVDFTNMGAQVDKVVLKEYTTFDGKDLVLITPSEDNMSLVFSTEDNRTVETNELVFTAFVDGAPASADTVVASDGPVKVSYRAYVGANDSNASVSTDKYLEFCYTIYPDAYKVDYDINFKGINHVVRNTPYMDFAWNNRLNRQEKVDQSVKGSRQRQKDAEKFNTNLYFKPTKDKVDNLRLGSDSQKKVKTSVEWVAYKQQFFCAILMSDSLPFENADLATLTDRQDTALNYLEDMSSVVGLTYSGESDYSMNMHLFYGPSKYRDLRAMHKGFERMLPLGWGFFLTQWFSRFIIIPVFNFLEQFGWNYGIIIIVLTILLKIVLFPLSYKSYQGSAIMRILQPEMDLLNKKYPNQEQALQKSQEMQKLQRKAGYNPMMGCLPMLIQFPILIAMYRFYPASIELRQQSFLWCDDLSTYDSILNFGFNVPMYGDHVSLFCLLMFGMQFFYTWYTMKSQNSQASMPGMKFMMYFMPFMMLFIFNNQSAALNIYYFLNLVITMLSMILIRKFTSESKVRARIAAYDLKHKNAPQKKSKFQERLEQMQKMNEELERQRRAQQRK